MGREREAAWEEVVNAVTDADAAWWPFLFLRPPPHERITALRLLSLSALYGVLGGVMTNAAARAIEPHVDLHPLVFPAAATLGVFLLLQVFAVSWNRRAGRLQAAMARVVA